MGENYYLFRGDLLIYKNENQEKLGAGSSHALGQQGDVLVHEQRGKYTVFQWHQPDISLGTLPWPEVTITPDQLAHYKALILIQR